MEEKPQKPPSQAARHYLPSPTVMWLVQTYIQGLLEREGSRAKGRTLVSGYWGYLDLWKGWVGRWASCN